MNLLRLAPLCLAAAAALAQQPPEVKVRVEPQNPTVGDPITIDFDLALPAGAQARLQPVGPSIGEFTILQTYPGPGVPEERGKAKTAPTPGHHHARIVAALYRVGEFEFPPLELTVTEAGRDVAVKTPAVKVRIASVISEKDPRLKDLKTQAEIHDPFPWVLAAAAAAGLLALAALAWWLRRRRRPPAAAALPEIDPFAAAEAQLRDLLGRGLLQKGFVKHFYVDLSEIIRRVLDAGFDIPTAEKTTAEIIESLRALDCSLAPQGASAARREILESLQSSPAGRNLEASELAALEQFLTGCDLVKFARYGPPKEENDAAVKRAFEILALCRRRRAPAAAAAAVEVS
jgi:hypothetical protein